MSRNILSVKGFSRKNPAFSDLSLRDLIFKAEDRANSRGEIIKGNGLAEVGAILRVGRKVLIDEDRFFDWIDQQQPNPVTGNALKELGARDEKQAAEAEANEETEGAQGVSWT